jgi:hypothetical protein
MLGHDMPRPNPAPKARPTKFAGRVAERHEAEYRRLLFALYVIIVDDAWTYATNGYLAKQTGLSTKAVKRGLEEMARRGVIRIFDWGFGRIWRTMVLLDDPRAKGLIEEIESEQSWLFARGKHR